MVRSCQKITALISTVSDETIDGRFHILPITIDCKYCYVLSRNFVILGFLFLGEPLRWSSHYNFSAGQLPRSSVLQIDFGALARLRV